MRKPRIKKITHMHKLKHTQNATCYSKVHSYVILMKIATSCKYVPIVSEKDISYIIRIENDNYVIFEYVITLF